MRGTAGDDVIAGLGGDDRIYGLEGNDDLCGGGGNDILRGGDGLDFVAPGPGDDLAHGGKDAINSVSYYGSPAGVDVDLRAGVATGWGHDVVRGFHQVEGTEFADRLAGDVRGNALTGYGGDDLVVGRGGDDGLGGGRGSDVVRGGRGSDWVAFTDSPARVIVDLDRGTSRGEGGDALVSIENVFGSRFDDDLAGTDGDNAFIGGIGEGDDAMARKGGGDLFFRLYGDGNVDGGRGRDGVRYEFRGAIDLVAGTAVGTDFSDTISRIENVFGGSGRHLITGGDGPNVLSGGGGPDLLRGAAGDDFVTGERGDDWLAGGDGDDFLDGGRGTDTCIEGEDVDRCEVPAIAASRDPDQRARRHLSHPSGICLYLTSATSMPRLLLRDLGCGGLGPRGL